MMRREEKARIVNGREIEKIRGRLAVAIAFGRIFLGEALASETTDRLSFAVGDKSAI